MRSINSLLVLVAVLFALVAPLSAQSSDVKTGDTITLPFWGEVQVVNLNPVAQRWSFIDYHVLLKYGDTCEAAEGGAATVIGIDGDRVLVRYKAPGKQDGVDCPTGILFFASKVGFLRMTPEGQKREKDFIREAVEATRPARKEQEATKAESLTVTITSPDGRKLDPRLPLPAKKP